VKIRQVALTTISQRDQQGMAHWKFHILNSGANFWQGFSDLFVTLENHSPFTKITLNDRSGFYEANIFMSAVFLDFVP